MIKDENGAPQEFVYILKPEKNDVYKIGQTTRPAKRLIEVQRKFPFKVKFVRVFRVSESSGGLESFLHAHYSKYHIGGDWFVFNQEELQDVIKYIDAISCREAK